MNDTRIAMKSLKEINSFFYKTWVSSEYDFKRILENVFIVQWVVCFSFKWSKMNTYSNKRLFKCCLVAVEEACYEVESGIRYGFDHIFPQMNFLAKLKRP